MCGGEWIHLGLILFSILYSKMRFIPDREYFQIIIKKWKSFFFNVDIRTWLTPTPLPRLFGTVWLWLTSLSLSLYLSLSIYLSLGADILYVWSSRKKRKLDCLFFQWKNTRKNFFKISILQLNNSSLIASVIWNQFWIDF